MEELIQELQRISHVHRAKHEGSGAIRGLQNVSVELTTPHPANRIKAIAARHGFSAADADFNFGRKGVEVTDTNERTLSIGFIFPQSAAYTASATLMVPTRIDDRLRGRLIAFFRSLHDPASRRLQAVK